MFILHNQLHLPVVVRCVHSAASALRGTGLTVSESHDAHSSLVPPVKHPDHQDMPHLVTGAQVVQLAWEITFRDLCDIKEERRSSNQVHDYHTRQEELYDIRCEPSGEPDPVAGRDNTDSSHAAEDGRAYPLPAVAKIVRMNLSAEDCQDQGQHCQKVNLPPKCITVESIEDPRNIAAEDAN